MINNSNALPALVVGGLNCDLTDDIDEIPHRNTKGTALQQVLCLGGGAAKIARGYNALGLPCELLAPVGLDGTGDDYRKLLGGENIQLLHRDVHSTPFNVVLIEKGERTIIRAPKPAYLHPDMFPMEPPRRFCRLILDGNEPGPAAHYAKAFREAGLTVSLDANVRDNTDELVPFAHIINCSKKYFESKDLQFEDFFAFLRRGEDKFCCITFDDQPIVWSEKCGEIKYTEAFHVPSHECVDTNGSGDAYNAGLNFSHQYWGQEKSWEDHVKFGAAFASLKIRQFGNAHFPTLESVMALINGRPEVLRAANQ